jgi:hypothetical protein
MPTPNGSESKKDFIERCIPILVKEGKPQDQAVAICYSKWERKNEDITNKIDSLINELAMSNKGFNFKTKKDKTGHIHDLMVDENGNGKTTKTIGSSKDHVHKIFEWSVQPSNGHIHTIKEKKK